VTLRLVPKLRKSSGFQALAAAYEPLDEFLDTLVGALGQVRRACTRLEPHGLPDFEAIMSDLDGEIDFFASTHEQLRRWIREPDENEIYWLVSARDQPIAALHAAPLHVGRLCQEVLWQQKAGVVLTSATLQSEHSFAYLQSRLSAEHFATLDVGTPFDYVSSTLLYLPNDLPGQDDRNKQQQAIERSIIELAVALGGRTMCLFTSYAQLRQTAAAISGRLRLGGITVFDQSDGVSRQSLLDSFRHTTNSVLLGTRTFWEGVDIPGEALSALVIVKLPFAVPTDPIVAARTETYSNAFYDYSVPDAVIRFRQGFGRLIRTRTDRGVVVVLDGRILTARYGERFLASLPECTIQMGSIRDLASAARQWINPEPALE
jgi:DNA polymerase-3 subunit epsilon/ATP-dependent DNA helicase DinG